MARNRMQRAGIFSSVSVMAVLMSAPLAFAQADETPPIVPDVLENPAAQIYDLSQSMMLGLDVFGDTITAVGERGYIVHSSDSGANWTQALNVPVSVALTDVEFSDELTGWAVGHSGVILRSHDGGANWQLVMDGNGVAETIYNTAQSRVDAGIESAQRELRSAQYLVDEGPDKPILKIFFDTAQHGFVLGAYGIALETTDGGQTWESVVHRIPNVFGAHLYDMARFGDWLIIVGEQGAVFASADNGETFDEVESAYEGTFFGVVGESDDTAILHGLRGNVWHLTLSLEDVTTDDGSAEDPDIVSDPAFEMRADWRQIDNGPEVTVSAGTVMTNGDILLADQGGRLTVVSEGVDESIRLDLPGAGTVTDIVVTDAGDIIVTGPRGTVRVSSEQSTSGGF